MVCHHFVHVNKFNMKYRSPKRKYVRKYGKKKKKVVEFKEEKYHLIDCPICNKNNKVCITDVYSSDVKCCVCVSNNVDVYLPQCGHDCICCECLVCLSDIVLLPRTVKIISTDMGSCRVYRRNLNGIVDCLIMGSDDWGQYDTSMLNKYYDFIGDYYVS